MLVIHDEHDTYHGRNVEAIVRESYNGPVALVENPDNGAGHLFVAKSIREWADKGAKVYNLSYGGGHAEQYGEWAQEVTQALKYAFLKGMTVVFAGGNFPQGKMDASILAATLWSIDCGGINKTGDGVGDYSQHHPALIEYYLSGYYDGVAGTSYAAPRLSAVISNIQQSAGWSLGSCQIRSALLESARYFEHSNVWLSTPQAPFYSPSTITPKLKVTALYALYMQRQPDQGGLDYWVPRVAREGIYDMAMAFKNSPEYEIAKNDPFNYDQVPAIRQIMAMYHLFLNREADAGGVAWWGEELLKTANPDTNIRSIAERFIAGARANGESIDERLLF